MRLTFAAFGLELDITLGPAGEPEAEDDGGRDLGYTTATPVGFIPAYELPDEISLPMRNNGWGDEGNRL